MRRKSLTPLGETEMEILHHVWQLKSATVGDVRDRIQQERPIAYTTVMTVMRNLAGKGYLTFEKEGNTYIYSPLQSAGDVQRSLLRDLVTKVFRGSPTALVQTLVSDEELSDQDIERIRNLIDGMEGDHE
ncbi:MAG: BlaI/MecI/CopY family transcriptional regulator [Rhodothermales bacterium]|nr:BlaI/MecI/CopY family transcriptional regulator [Rhodothermales bacterium]